MLLFLAQFALEQQNARKIALIIDIVYEAKEEAKQQGSEFSHAALLSRGARIHQSFFILSWRTGRNKEKTNEKHGQADVEVPSSFVVKYLGCDMNKKILRRPGIGHRTVPEGQERNGTK